MFKLLDTGKNTLERLIKLIYPTTCGICEKICAEPICTKCNYIIKGLMRNKKHIYLTKNYDTHFYVFDYNDLIREEIIKYKFGEKSYLNECFSQILLNNKKICGFFERYDIIIPVPISRKRKNFRGYNQSELIAKNVAKHMKNLVCDTHILYKIKDNKPQSKLNKEKRIQNVKDVYYIKNVQTILNKNVLLFDDIYTTGSTLNECAKILKEAGANKISAFTLAKD